MPRSETEDFQMNPPTAPLIGIPPMPPKVADAIAKVMGEVPKLKRGEKNSHGDYNFASIDDFLEALRPLNAKHGLVIVQDEGDFTLREGKDKYGKPTSWLLMSFRFTLAHASGETWAHQPTRSIMVNASMGSQAFGAAQSYTLKQFTRSLFQIATGEKGQDADEHPPADLPQRNGTKAQRGPLWGASRQAKARGDWGELENDLRDCGSAVTVDKLQRDYQANQYPNWSVAWREQADELFEKRREDFGAAPGEALTLREQLQGSIEAETPASEPATRADYLRYCTSTIDMLSSTDEINQWWDEQTAARKRFRLSPSEEEGIKALAKERLKALRKPGPTTTFVPNARERAEAKAEE